MDPFNRNAERNSVYCRGGRGNQHVKQLDATDFIVQNQASDRGAVFIGVI